MELIKFIDIKIRKYLNESKIGEYESSTILLNDLYVNEENMNDAYNKRIHSNNKVSKTKRPLEVFKMKDGSLFLIDGHHRIIDEIINNHNKEKILQTKFKSEILQTNTNTYLDALNSKLYYGYIPFKEWIKTIKI